MAHQEDVAATMIEALRQLRKSIQDANAPKVLPGDVATTTPQRSSLTQNKFLGSLNSVLDSLASKMGASSGKEAKINEQEKSEAAKKELEILKVKEENAQLEKRLLGAMEENLRKAQAKLTEAHNAGASPATLAKHIRGIEGKKKALAEQQKQVNKTKKEASEQLGPAREARKAWAQAQRKLNRQDGGFNLDSGIFKQAGKSIKRFAQKAGFNFGGGKPGSIGNVAGDLGSIAMDAPLAMEGDPKAIDDIGAKVIKMNVENLQAMMGDFKNMGKEGMKAVTSERFGDTGLHAMEATTSMAKGLGRAVGGPVGGAILEKMIDMNPMKIFMDSILKSINFLQDFGDQLHNANMKFAEFSGAMTGVQVRQEIREMELSIERGGRRSSSAESLEEGRNELNQALAPIEDALAIVKNYVVGDLSKLAAYILGPITQAAKVIIEWLPKSSEIEEGNEADRVLGETINPWEGYGRR